jgi:hypothetical protein
VLFRRAARIVASCRCCVPAPAATCGLTRCAAASCAGAGALAAGSGVPTPPARGVPQIDPASGPAVDAPGARRDTDDQEPASRTPVALRPIGGVSVRALRPEAGGARLAQERMQDACGRARSFGAFFGSATTHAGLIVPALRAGRCAAARATPHLHVAALRRERCRRQVPRGRCYKAADGGCFRAAIDSRAQRLQIFGCCACRRRNHARGTHPRPTEHTHACSTNADALTLAFCSAPRGALSRASEFVALLCTPSRTSCSTSPSSATRPFRCATACRACACAA